MPSRSSVSRRPAGSAKAPGRGTGSTTNPPRAACWGVMMTSRPSRPRVNSAAASPTRARSVGQGEPTTVFQTTTADSGSIPRSAAPPRSRSWNVATRTLPAAWIGALAGPGASIGDAWIDPCSGSSRNFPEWPHAAQSSRSDRASAYAGPEARASEVSLATERNGDLGRVVADGERLECRLVAGRPDDLAGGRGRLPRPARDLHLLHRLDL